MTTLVIVSIGLSLTQLVTLGWLARRTTRANRNIDNLTTQCVGYSIALEVHERRLDMIYTNHASQRDRLDTLCRQVKDLDADFDLTCRQQAQTETTFERQLRGINGDIDTLFDDVLIQKGGGL